MSYFYLFYEYLARASKNDLAWLQCRYELVTFDVGCLTISQIEASSDFLISVIHYSHFKVNVVVPNCLIQRLIIVFTILNIVVELRNLLVLKKCKATFLHFLRLTLSTANTDLVNVEKTLSGHIINSFLFYLLFLVCHLSIDTEQPLSFNLLSY